MKESHPERCHLILTFAWVSPPTTSFPLQLFVAFVMKIMILSNILYIFTHPIIHISGKISLTSCSQFMIWLYFFGSFGIFLKMSSSIYPWSFVFLLSFCGIIFALPEIVRGIQASNRFLLLFVRIGLFTSSVNTL